MMRDEGKRSWVVIYRDKDGKLQAKEYDTEAKARRAAGRLGGTYQEASV
jgi:hypothetical protein